MVMTSGFTFFPISIPKSLHFDMFSIPLNGLEIIIIYCHLSNICFNKFAQHHATHYRLEKGYFCCIGSLILFIISFKMLVQKGAAVNVSSRYWNHATSLHYCSQLGKLENIKLLLNYGANVFIKDKCGQTARERAHKHPECEKLLWEKEGAALSWSAFQKLELAIPVILKMKLF